MTDNIMGIALEITANPEQAQAAINQVRESAQALAAQSKASAEAAQAIQAGMGTQYATMAEALKSYGDNIGEVAAQYKLYGVAGSEAAREIQAAFQSTDEQTKQALADAHAYYEEIQAAGAAPGAGPGPSTPGGAQGALQQTAAAAQESAAVQQEAFSETSAAAAAAAEKEISSQQAVATAQKEEAAQAEATAQAVKSLYAQIDSSAQGTVEATARVAGAQREVNATQQAMQRTVAESLQMQGASAEEAAQIYTQLRINGRQAAAEISAAYGNAGTAATAMGEEAAAAAGKATRGTSLWHTMNQGVIGDLRLMRYSMYAFTTPLMFAYIIPQIGRMVDGIKEAISAMEGLDSDAQKAFADIVKGADDALVHFQGLTTAEKIATGQMLIAQTEQRINADVAARTAIEGQSFWNVLSQYIDAVTGALGGNSAALATLGAEFSAKSKATSDELQQNVLLQKQLKELQQLEKQLQKQHQHAAAGLDKIAQAQERWNDVIATATVKLPPFVSEVERLQRALLVPDARANNTLFAYAELNAERLNEHLKPLEATLKQLGIATPELSAPGVPTGLLNMQLNAATKLDAAQRDRLPTLRELRLANQELEREYPQLTAAERQQWAQIMLTSEAYRQHIDAVRSIHSANAQLGASFSALAAQVRTAFSEMAGQLTGWGGVGTRVFDQMFTLVQRQIVIQQRQVAEHQIAQVSMTKATIDGLKQLAVVKAVVDAAKGFEALGELNFWSAAQYFAGAALWGTVGAFQIASMAGAFSPGTGSKSVASAASTSSAAATGTSLALAAGTASAQAAAKNQQHTWQIIFTGPIYGGPAGTREIVNKINNEVRFNRLQLIASHTITGKVIT